MNIPKLAASHCQEKISHSNRDSMAAHVIARNTRDVQRVVLKSGMWRDQSDRLVCNQHYIMY